MSFEYSIFISYRRNEGDKKFLENLKKIIESEAQKVTNIKQVFFDDRAIGWGDDFDKNIYNGITSSYFFILIYHITYLHVDNVWCARELYHAIEVEKVIQKAIGNKNYCYILPMIFRGQIDALPECIHRKNAKEIRQLEAIIISNKTNKKLTEFKNYIYDTILSSFILLDEANINMNELCSKITIPTDEEIKTWIKRQKERIKAAEAEKPPRLSKNNE